jgi:hypothetical protein
MTAIRVPTPHGSAHDPGPSLLARYRGDLRDTVRATHPSEIREGTTETVHPDERV